jgi:hypothetical protein
VGWESGQLEIDGWSTDEVVFEWRRTAPAVENIV